MQDRNIKRDHFHLEGIGVPQLLKEFFFNFRGFKFKMSLPSQSSPSRNYTSPFSGVVLLSFYVAGLQNSRLNQVECAFSTISTRVHLPGGVSFLSVYLRIYRCTAGISPDCCSFLHFPYFFGTFLITDFLFCDLLLGNVFSGIITIVCINNNINEI